MDSSSTMTESEGQGVESSVFVTSPTTITESVDNQVDNVCAAMAMDIFDHLINEDWEYLYSKYDLPENSVAEPTDIKVLHMAENAAYYSAYERPHHLRERGYTLSADDMIWDEDEEGNKFVLVGIRNREDTIEKRIAFVPVGESPSDYRILRSVDYGRECNLCGYEPKENEAGFGGAFLVVPEDARNITLRGLLIKEEWRDDNLFVFENEEDAEAAKESSQYARGKFKAYRVIIPQTTVYDNEFHRQDAERYLDQKGMDVGTVTPFTLSYETDEGSVTFQTIENNWLSYNGGWSERYFYVGNPSYRMP